MLKAVHLRGRDVTDAGITFREGEEIREIDVELTSRPTSVTGVVTDSRNAVVEDCSVLIFPRDRVRWNGSSGFLQECDPNSRARAST